MEQYEKSGPPLEKKPPAATGHHDEMRRLAQRIEELEKHIKDQDRELRKIKNDLRMSVNAINRMNNGKT